MQLNDEIQTYLNKKLTADEKEKLGISKRGAKWADAVAFALVKKRAAGDIQATKLIRETSPEKAENETVITVRICE